MMTVAEYLESQGRSYPEPDCDDGESISMFAFEDANLPMAVACTACSMTMALRPGLRCTNDGEVFCDGCAELWALENDEPEPSLMIDRLRAHREAAREAMIRAADKVPPVKVGADVATINDALKAELVGAARAFTVADHYVNTLA